MSAEQGWSIVERTFEAEELPVDVDETVTGELLPDRAAVALQMIVQYGGIDGAHHKDWVLDQVTRALTGADYERFVARARAGEDGLDTFSWSTGIAP